MIDLQANASVVILVVLFAVAVFVYGQVRIALK
jgi:hypothetical protein